MKRKQTDRGSAILKRYNLPAQRGHFSKTGDFYKRPDEFPAFFADQNGYVLFESAADYEGNKYISRRFFNDGTERAFCRDIVWGICNMPNYQLFPDKSFTSAEEISEHPLVEGATKQVLVNAYERNALARQKCIAHYQAICAVCEMNFAERYGEIGEGFIHVHHLKPLSEVDEEYVVNPVEDLRPVCPNCHAMLHRRTPPFSIEELREKMRAQQKTKY